MTRIVDIETQKEMSKTNPDEQIAYLKRKSGFSRRMRS